MLKRLSPAWVWIDKRPTGFPEFGARSVANIRDLSRWTGISMVAPVWRAEPPASK
jgi:hypothetical protein